MKCLGIPGQGFEVPGIDRTGIDRTDRTLGCDVLRCSRRDP